MNIKYNILTLLLLFGVSSCEEYLETEPTDFLSPSNYYETEDQLNFARASVYHTLGASGLFGSWANYLLGWEADIGYMNRASLTTGPWNYNFSSADPYNAGYWSNLFDGINRANVVLENVDKNPEIDQEFRDQLRGEILFLRGYYYFQLVQYYGGVPIFTSPTTSVEDVDVPKNTVREVYDQIVADMTAAEPLVADIATLGFGGQVSKSAVRGMLARVNLHMAGEPLKDPNGYAEASRWAKMVIDDASAAHSLNPDYTEIFKNLAGDRYDIKESIWEAEFWGNRTDQYVETTNLGWINGPPSNVNSETGRADSYMSITAKFYNSYEPGDQRKWFCIAHFAYTVDGPNGSKTLNPVPTTELAKYGLRPAKWRREFETLLPKAPTTTPQNFPILRYTDVVLMYAEAQNELNGGPTAEVINLVNQVRERAWAKGIKEITLTSSGSGYTSAPTVTIGGDGGATATATVANGMVTEITLERDPAGEAFYLRGNYSSPPSISITGGGGSGASATATIFVPEDAHVTPAQTASKESFLQFLQEERMREFNFEGLRKGDLLRWGNFLEVMANMGNTVGQDAPGAFYVRYYSNVEPKHQLLPIPTDETTVNEAMEQNPGWD
ncbi:MAG TPA: RagB/SusD family nutrient uptake outer membrane protein [Cyclobacteriaceae bacterium]|nr:RagB/SusD family nutrient uptake outer membrane protein [Cyclobacteriaceae bacterium]